MYIREVLAKNAITRMTSDKIKNLCTNCHIKLSRFKGKKVDF